MRHAVGQAGGAVGERVEVGIGRVGVEADTVSPSASVWSVMSVLKTGAWLVLVDRPGEGVGVGDRAVGDGEDDVVGARAGRASVPLMTPVLESIVTPSGRPVAR